MFQKASCCLSLLFFLLVLLPGSGGAAPIAGKLTLEGKGASGARLLAWPTSVLSLSDPAPHRSAPSDGEGRFTLDLPPGDYYLLARGEGLFSFYGRNPVTVPEEGLSGVHIGLLPKDLPPPERKAESGTGILGKVTADGKALEGAVAYLYPDLTSGLKGMGLAMAVTGEGGIFEAAVPPGTYYLVVRFRSSGEIMGPLQAGDFIGFWEDNPLKVKAGEVARVALPVLEVPQKGERFADTLFGQTSIRGKVIDIEGKPLAGVRAVVYDEAAMLNRPLFVSPPTGADGTFVLSLPRGGRYYLAARSALGGAPAPGELYGTYDGRPDHALQMVTGERREGVEIVAEEMW